MNVSILPFYGMLLEKKPIWSTILINNEQSYPEILSIERLKFDFTFEIVLM